MKKKRLQLNQVRLRRKGRVRAKVSGTAEKPRLSVFRSLKHISAQIIDDKNGKTLVGASDVEVKSDKNKTDKSFELGKLIASKAKEKNITSVVFDKGRFKYHGRVKALAEGAREGGLKI